MRGASSLSAPSAAIASCSSSATWRASRTIAAPACVARAGLERTSTTLPELLFECLDALADGGRGDAQAPGRSIQRALVDHDGHRLCQLERNAHHKSC